MKIRLILILIAAMLSACSNKDIKNDSEIAIGASSPPQLWSFHKNLELAVDVCALRGYRALKSLGYSSVVQNGNYSYGNFRDNRAAVKCVEVANGSFVYLAVAGPVKNVVEKLRNEIARKY